MSYFIFEHLEQNRKEFSGMTFEDFSDHYVVTDALAEQFITYARLQEAHIDMTDYLEELKLALKANIGQQLFGPNAYEFILNEQDSMLQKVRELEAAF